jgi:beta-galactosidase
MRWLRFFLAALLLFMYARMPAQHLMNGDRQENFDRNWKFLLGDHQNASTTGFNHGNWRTLDLPHDGSMEGKIAATNPSGADGGYFLTGINWYRKTFRLGQQLQQKKKRYLF